MVILHVLCVHKPYGNGVVNAANDYVKYELIDNQVAIFNLDTALSKYLNQNSTLFSFAMYNSIKVLPKPFNKPDLVVFNEIYKKKYLKLYKECLDNKIPYVIIPHGCLVKAAQRKKFLKKTVANLLFFNKFIKKSVAIQYLNENEKNNSIVKKHKYIISGNGIEISNKKNRFINKDFVYIGRYDIKVKGLDLIIKTVINNKDWFKNNKVRINLYGRNSGNGYNELQSMIINNSISDIIILNDAIYGDAKKKVLLESYCFVQVSRHEGQPMGIMEALSYGLPCIVTYGTSFGEYVNDNKCGIGINFNSKELFNAIKRLYVDEKLRNCYSKNTKVVEKDYEWNNVIKKCLNDYKEIL